MKLAKGVLLSLALLAQACSVAPMAEPSASSGEPSVPSPVAPATAPVEPFSSDAASASFDVTWERVAFPEWDAITTGMWGDGRWIVGGFVWCDLGWCPRIWTSNDGRSWTGAELPEQDGMSVKVTAFARDTHGYVGAALTCTANGVLKTSTALFWRSADGGRWEVIGSVKLGTIAEDCVGIDHLVATEAGLVGTTQLRKASPSFVIESSEGVDWAPTSSESFGLPPETPLSEPDTIQVDPSSAIIAAGCRACPVAVWRSGKGRAWTELGRLAPEDSVHELSVAMGPRPVVAAFAINQELYGEQPVCDLACRTSVWALEDGSFRQVFNPDMPHRPRLAFTGDAYLLVGTSAVPRESVAYASVDGLEWTKVPTDPGVCRAGDLIAGPSQTLFLGTPFGYPSGPDESLPNEDACGGMWLVDVSRA